MCGLEVGDYFEVTESSRVRIPEGKHFCLFALQSVLPLLPAKMRRLPDEDWLEQDSLVACPDPDERADHAHRAHRRARRSSPRSSRSARARHRAAHRPGAGGVRGDRAARGGRGHRRHLGLPRPPLPARDRAAAPDGSRDRAGSARAGRAQPVHAASVRDRRPDRDARLGLRRTRVPRPREGRVARPARDRRGAAAVGVARGGRDRPGAARGRRVRRRRRALRARARARRSRTRALGRACRC